MKKNINKEEKVMQGVKINKKNFIIIICAIVALIATIGIGIFVFEKYHETEEQKLTKVLEELGRDWYENHYYDALEKNSTNTPRDILLNKFSDSGFKIGLDSLTLQLDGEKRDETVKRFEKIDCDKEETKVIIYPQSPFGKKDYKIETKMQCVNEKNKNKK